MTPSDVPPIHRRAAVRAFVVAFAAAVAAASHGGAQAGVNVGIGNGDRVTGSLDPANEVESFQCDVPAGASLTITAAGKRSKFTRKAPTVTFRVLGPDSQELAPFQPTVGTGSRLRNLPVPASGVHRVEVRGDGAIPGDYSLVVKWRARTKFPLAATLAPGGTATFPFAAEAGADVTFDVRPGKGSHAVPRFARVHDVPDDFSQTLPAPPAGATRHRLNRIRLDGKGDLVADVADTGTAGGTVTGQILVAPRKAKPRSVVLTTAVLGTGSTSAVGAVVGTDGGDVTVDDDTLDLDGASVRIPQGSLAYPTAIVVSSARDLSTPTGLGAAGPAVNFGPDGTVFKAGKPATLTIPLDLSVLGGDTSAVRIYTRDAKGRIQEVLPASSYVFDLAAGTVSFPAAHFSSYQAFGVIAKIARGDLDGDGFADLVMPAPAAGTSGEGRIFIVRGGPVLSSRNTSAASFTIAGTGPGDALGHAFVVADVNGDGTDDLIAGVAGGTPRVVVYFGGPDFILTGLPDVTISRGAGDGATFAATLTAGDLNDDGVADVVVGDPGSSRGASQAGACFVFFGPVTAARNADAADVILTGTGTGDRFAISLAAGDVVTAGGDAGAHDLVVGADQADVAPAANGKVYVFRGPLAAGSASASTAQAVLVGDAAGSAFGLPVSVGDVDGGGMADIVAGAAGADTGPLTDPGKVFVFRGEGSIGTTAGDVPFATLSGRNAGDRAGRAFAVADFTGGNDAEVALGIPGDEAAATDSGSVAVWNGTTTGATDAAPGALPRIYGAASGRKLGSQYVAAADLNGDGHDDLIVGDPADATNGADAGAVFVFFGGGSPFPSGTSTTTANIVIRGAAGQKLGLVGP